jgi:hypothetical protein
MYFRIESGKVLPNTLQSQNLTKIFKLLRTEWFRYYFWIWIFERAFVSYLS